MAERGGGSVLRMAPGGWVRHLLGGPTGVALEGTLVLLLTIVAVGARPPVLVAGAGYVVAMSLLPVATWAGLGALRWAAGIACLGGVLAAMALAGGATASFVRAGGPLLAWGVAWGMRLQGALEARAHQRSERRARHLATLHEITRAMARPLQLDPLFETIHREVARVMPADAFIIALYDADAHTLDAAFIFDKGRRYPPERRAADTGPTAEVVRTGRPVFLNRSPEEMQQRVVWGHLVGAPEEPASVIVVPMPLEGRVVGTISAQSYRPRAYTPDDVELLSTIAGQAAVCIQNARLYEQTVELALTDPLTGLGNARFLQQSLSRELARARRAGRPLGLLMLDSDHLKAVNDRYGHPTGDRFLTMLADVMRAHVRAGDLVARYAGDEFVAVLPEAGIADTTAVAQRIVDAVAQSPLVLETGERVYTTVSAGVAAYPDAGSAEEDLMRSVDRALYAAKQSGKGRVCCASLTAPGPTPPPV